MTFYLRLRGEIGRLTPLRGGWCSQGRVGSNLSEVTFKSLQARQKIWLTFSYPFSFVILQLFLDTLALLLI
jgi:hypothetical protein